MEVLEESNTKTEEKKCRERKKHILSALQKQIEFYFGDANLRHDRFLRKAIHDNCDGYVAIDVIANFNKLKQTSSSLNLVVKAMQNSDLLEVTEDKLQVRRKLPLPEAKSADAHTIYVERLPAHADQEWLREVFSYCGNIEYISLPRYKTTRKIKGFAFIEYSSAEDAEKACKVLNTIPSRTNKHAYSEDFNVNHSQAETAESQPVVNSTVNQNRVKRKRRKSESVSESDGEWRCANSKHSSMASCNCKRRRSNSESINCPDLVETSSKSQPVFHSKSPTCDDSKELVDNKTNVTHECTNSKLENYCQNVAGISPLKVYAGVESEGVKSAKLDNMLENEINIESSKDAIDNENGIVEKEINKKEKRRRKRNKKAKEEKQLDIPPLYVITKKEWVRLKELYKNMQRDDAKALKMKIQENSSSGAVKCTNTVGTEEGSKQILSISTKPLSIPIVSGTILELTTVDPNETLVKKNIKKELGSHPSIAYIDVKDGECEGHIRMNDVAATNSLMETFGHGHSGSDLSFNLRCLSNLEEEAYFGKIDEDRKRKFSEKPKKKRGVEKVKIQRKVQATLDTESERKREHIHFDED